MQPIPLTGFPFSDIPSDLESGPVVLSFEKIVTPESDGELVPFYHFKITCRDGTIVGHINFRVGDTRHIRLCAGHIGFEILPQHRRHSYSLHACRALAPFIRKHYERVILTVDPDNVASTRTIEKLGARFVDEIEVPPDDPSYAGGARRKRRYEWTLGD
jgi:predicted acetyltransferase